MRTIDLTTNYTEGYLKNGKLEEYERQFPELFKHYFTYWGSRKSFTATLGEEEVLKRAMLIKQCLPTIEQCFLKNALDTSKLDVVLFVGGGWTNGHAFEHRGKFIVWLPIEGYETKRQVLAFVPHEIVHALHYAHSFAFYFQDKEEKERLSRLLIAEGIATAISARVMGITDGEALWADYLSESQKQSWVKKCKKRKSELYAYALKHFSSSAHSQLFYTGDPTDILKNRAGYFIGNELIKGLVQSKKLTAQELLSLPRKRFERETRGLLARR